MQVEIAAFLSALSITQHDTRTTSAVELRTDLVGLAAIVGAYTHRIDAAPPHGCAVSADHSLMLVEDGRKGAA
jgi:hypothetical protein